MAEGSRPVIWLPEARSYFSEIWDYYAKGRERDPGVFTRIRSFAANILRFNHTRNIATTWGWD
jgi:plasmid stabilization system protein ParE